MSPTAKRYPVPSSKAKEQARLMAKKEVVALLLHANDGERAGLIVLARWYEKWQLLAGARGLGRILLDISRAKLKENNHG